MHILWKTAYIAQRLVGSYSNIQFARMYNKVKTADPEDDEDPILSS